MTGLGWIVLTSLVDLEIVERLKS